MARDLASEDGLLARELGRAIDAGWPGGVGLKVGRTLVAVEHVVGANVDQRDAGLGAEPGKNGRAIAVGAGGGVRLLLGRVDGGPGGGVDDKGRLRRRESRADRLRAVEVQVGAAHAVDAAATLLQQGGGQLPGPASHQGGHCGNQPRAASKPGSTLSLSDSTAAPGSMGQGRFRVGSFQRTPRSLSLL